MRPLALATLAAAAALLGLPALGATAASAAKKRPTCMKAKGRTVAINTEARAFTTRRGSVLWGCTAGSRPRRLAREHDDDYVTSGAVRRVELAGFYVAYGYVSTDISCKAACPPDYDPTTEFLRVMNLKSRRATTTTEWQGERFALTRTGAAAWIAGRGSGPRTVKAFFMDTVSDQDSGAIDDGSIEASASRITWMKDGRIHGAFFG